MNKVGIIIAIILLVLNSYLLFNYFKLKTIYLELSNKIEQINYSIHNTKLKLNKLHDNLSIIIEKIQTINKNLNNLATKLNNLKTDIYENSLKISNIKKKISNLILNTNELINELNKINASLHNLYLEINYLEEAYTNVSRGITYIQDWLGNGTSFEFVSSIVQAKINDFIYECKKSFPYNSLDLGCLSYLIYNKLGIRYINDSEFGKADILFPVNIFLEHKGGDCEDYSLFYVALLNYIYNDLGIRKLIVPIYSQGKKYELYKEGNIIWYLPNHEKYIIDLTKYHYFYVVCYDLGTLGHCQVAICNIPIFKTSDLEKCIIIEPQAYAEVYKINKNKLCHAETCEKINAIEALIWEKGICKALIDDKLVCVEKR